MLIMLFNVYMTTRDAKKQAAVAAA